MFKYKNTYKGPITVFIGGRLKTIQPREEFESKYKLGDDNLIIIVDTETSIRRGRPPKQGFKDGNS